MSAETNGPKIIVVQLYKHSTSFCTKLTEKSFFLLYQKLCARVSHDKSYITDRQKERRKIMKTRDFWERLFLIHSVSLFVQVVLRNVLTVLQMSKRIWEMHQCDWQKTVNVLAPLVPFTNKICHFGNEGHYLGLCVNCCENEESELTTTSKQSRRAVIFIKTLAIFYKSQRIKVIRKYSHSVSTVLCLLWNYDLTEKLLQLIWMKH